jgi:hypothetical protein
MLKLKRKCLSLNPPFPGYFSLSSHFLESKPLILQSLSQNTSKVNLRFFSLSWKKRRSNELEEIWEKENTEKKWMKFFKFTERSSVDADRALNNAPSDTVKEYISVIIILLKFRII